MSRKILTHFRFLNIKVSRWHVTLQISEANEAMTASNDGSSTKLPPNVIFLKWNLTAQVYTRRVESDWAIIIFEQRRLLAKGPLSTAYAPSGVKSRARHVLGFYWLRQWGLE